MGVEASRESLRPGSRSDTCWGAGRKAWAGRASHYSFERILARQMVSPRAKDTQQKSLIPGNRAALIPPPCLSLAVAPREHRGGAKGTAVASNQVHPCQQALQKELGWHISWLPVSHQLPVIRPRTKSPFSQASVPICILMDDSAEFMTVVNIK